MHVVGSCSPSWFRSPLVSDKVPITAKQAGEPPGIQFQLTIIDMYPIGLLLETAGSVTLQVDVLSVDVPKVLKSPPTLAVIVIAVSGQNLQIVDYQVRV